MAFGDNEVPLSLATICEGNLEDKFQEMYPALVSQLKEGDTAKLSIGLNFKKVENTDTMVMVSFSIKPTFPARSKAAMCQITEDNKLKGEKPKEKVVNLSLLKEGTNNG